ncbi:hypothetical protein Ancab_015951 [Ancistrocladus abbreviatus]
MATNHQVIASSILSLQSKAYPNSKIRNRTKPISLSLSDAHTTVQKEDIVIVGAGIAGLATAVCLQRLGVRSLVLEQAESLRTGGTSLTLFKNGWKALDAIGVGDELRTQFLEIEGILMKTDEGRELRSFSFKEEDSSQEVRPVERRVLLQTLADQLPPDAVKFASKLAKIEKAGAGETMLELDDGTQLSAKILIGCDGIRSSVAKWMGFPEPKYAGHCAFRGLAFYPSGQPLEPRVTYMYGRGVRAGYVPVSATKVYWFLCYNSPSPGEKITDPSQLKKQALDLLRNWPSSILDMIDLTPDDTIIRSPLEDRWLWPAITPPPSRGSVVLAGDAWHPMTPNLGQGGCCALEDAIVLVKNLSAALKSGQESVEEALELYGRQRWIRVFPLTIRANFVGALLQWDNPAICSIRNNLVVPKLVRMGPMLEHTNFACERL